MSFFEYMMRRAAPVLFWTAVLLFFGGLAISLLLERGIDPYSSGSMISPTALVSGIVQGLSAAVWPFMGAGIIWTLQRQRGEAGQ